MLDANEMKRRLAEALRDADNVSKADLARATSTTPQAVNGWFKTGRVDKKHLSAIADLLHKPVRYFLDSNVLVPYQAVAAGAGWKTSDVKAKYGNDATEALSIAIPIFDVSASMGIGASIPEHDTVVDTMRLTQTWVQRNLPAVSSPQNLAVISAYGDSMQPAFNDGDILLVDRGVTDFKLDAVYVIAWRGELYIKRIQRRGPDQLAIISDNKVYEPIAVSNGERGELKVLGRVLWAWNGKRL